MAIDIRNISSNKVATGAAQNKRAKDANSASDDVDGPNDDSVELTGKASKITSLIQQMVAAPAVNRSRVEPIKDKVDNDRYHVESEQVASRMLDFETSLNRVR